MSAYDLTKSEFNHLSHCNCMIYYKGDPYLKPARKFEDRYYDPSGLQIVAPAGWFPSSLDDILLYNEAMGISYLSTKDAA